MMLLIMMRIIVRMMIGMVAPIPTSIIRWTRVKVEELALLNEKNLWFKEPEGELMGNKGERERMTQRSNYTAAPLQWTSRKTSKAFLYGSICIMGP